MSWYCFGGFSAYWIDPSGRWRNLAVPRITWQRPFRRFGGPKNALDSGERGNLRPCPRPQSAEDR